MKAMESVMQKVSSTPAFARIAPKVVPRLDKAVHRLSGGRFMLSQWMLPSLFLTTTGRRSGEPRVTPLACLPQGETFLVIGSNFGRTSHPAWTGNLLADADATVDHRGKVVRVRGRLLTGTERADAWAALLRMWPPYATYQARVDREIRIFRLEPVP
ncbi:nitroreductase family deazaflavin-dependent oxidoreductase [Streptacidiphilus rugosus]|uniref:nitroreductase family deazaflavin-dependent oxidoreductase n=1 Tax=Streptacidiphilus rugosus TaxID=405783 RepID=UPI00056B91B0|nr:nitroreductase family deazaflavin-dependent oxidoreductase [Streptacidiphilus rugosus]